MAQSNRSPADTRSHRDRILAGDRYLAADPELVQEAQRAQMLGHEYGATSPTETARRRRLLFALLGSIGEGSEIRPPFYCDYGSQTHIGAWTFVGVGLVALDVARIDNGDDVQIGPRGRLLTPTHPLEPEARPATSEAAEPIVIGDDLWLGGCVAVCPGVSDRADTVVRAGSAVTRELPASVVAVGAPARVVRRLAAA